MPIVRVELYSGRTAEQKTDCAREIVAAVSRTLGVAAEATQVVFYDVERGDWLTGGKIPPPAAKKE
jgi:4-oxalocrotonate tautomerase